MTCTAKPPPPQIIVCINPQMCLYTPQKREGQQSQGENQQKPAILAHFPHQTAGKVSHLGENWAEKWDYFCNFGWGEGRGGDWERQRGDTRTARGTNTSIHTQPRPGNGSALSRNCIQGKAGSSSGMQQALGKQGGALGAAWLHGLGIWIGN